MEQQTPIWQTWTDENGLQWTADPYTGALFWSYPGGEWQPCTAPAQTTTDTTGWEAPSSSVQKAKWSWDQQNLEEMRKARAARDEIVATHPGLQHMLADVGKSQLGHSNQHQYYEGDPRRGAPPASDWHGAVLPEVAQRFRDGIFDAAARANDDAGYGGIEAHKITIVTAAALVVVDGKPKIVVAVNGHQEIEHTGEIMSAVHGEADRLAREHAARYGVPFEVVVDTQAPHQSERLKEIEARLERRGGELSPWTWHAEQKLLRHVKDTDGPIARATIEDLGIGHIHGPCTKKTAGEGANECDAYLHKKGGKEYARVAAHWYGKTYPRSRSSETTGEGSGQTSNDAQSDDAQVKRKRVEGPETTTTSTHSNAPEEHPPHPGEHPPHTTTQENVSTHPRPTRGEDVPIHTGPHHTQRAHTEHVDSYSGRSPTREDTHKHKRRRSRSRSPSPPNK